ncbi:hypothetical protein MRB53_033564 [Persea americana]|uniref:Uncharacterized protein n=1 Tax=Persea americana TaxID=3435 RepID=A0ACC2KW90_PERAE|nr:hypothetical protein MRB53_033564 [Persea americana]|eukprot:TRINITY_DN11953_c0_g1_i2.p1 TRINITY_DN11953_c0_g1~~TRINITY_DN11953_c0_g1_i2.p1  ORF type:complete len:333 (+),score=68.05 TRINITY_DN11953_c0_g1_i2:669-1667(+)
MKRLSSSDSLGATMISICPSAEEKGSSGGTSNVYNRGYQAILDGLDEEDCIEEPGHVAEKKRRLSIEQVKALEKNFEVENKLEPERKVKLAQELGLQPRQVAVWFQNRRARWKTKQLERDYGVLKNNYETLKLNFDALHRDKETLLAELRELKSKLNNDDKSEINHPIKEEIEPFPSESENKLSEEQSKISAMGAMEGSENTTDQNQLDHFNGGGLFADLKDGSSDSDSSAILNDDNSPNRAISSEAFLPSIMIYPPTSSTLRCSYSSSYSSSIGCLQFSDSRASANAQKAYHHQFPRMEEPSFLNGEEACDFFSEEQAPTLQWCSEPWEIK